MQEHWCSDACALALCALIHAHWCISEITFCNSKGGFLT